MIALCRSVESDTKMFIAPPLKMSLEEAIGYVRGTYSRQGRGRVSCPCFLLSSTPASWTAGGARSVTPACAKSTQPRLLRTIHNRHKLRTLTQAADDELIEVTPDRIRIRKAILDAGARARAAKRAAAEDAVAAA